MTDQQQAPTTEQALLAQVRQTNSYLEDIRAILLFVLVGMVALGVIGVLILNAVKDQGGF